MIYYIKTNKYNQINSWTVQELEDYTKIETDIKREELIQYAFIKNKLIKREITKEYPLDNLIYEWDGKDWILSMSLEEQKNYYLNKSLKIGKKMEEYKNIGLQGGQEYIDLEKELEVNKNKYIELCQTEAIKIDEHMQSIKSLK